MQTIHKDKGETERLNIKATVVCFCVKISFR